MSDNADVTSRLIHASSFMPGVRHWVITPHRIEMVAAIEAPDHVDQIVQRTQAMVRARR